MTENEEDFFVVLLFCGLSCVRTLIRVEAERVSIIAGLSSRSSRVIYCDSFFFQHTVVELFFKRDYVENGDLTG